LSTRHENLDSSFNESSISLALSAVDVLKRFSKLSHFQKTAAALSYVIQSYLERHFWLCAYNSSLKKASDLKILLSKIQSSHTEIFFDPVGF
jgi:hypothetical protein